MLCVSLSFSISNFTWRRRGFAAFSDYCSSTKAYLRSCFSLSILALSSAILFSTSIWFLFWRTISATEYDFLTANKFYLNFLATFAAIYVSKSDNYFCSSLVSFIFCAIFSCWASKSLRILIARFFFILSMPSERDSFPPKTTGNFGVSV